MEQKQQIFITKQNYHDKDMSQQYWNTLSMKMSLVKSSKNFLLVLGKPSTMKIHTDKVLTINVNKYTYIYIYIYIYIYH